MRNLADLFTEQREAWTHYQITDGEEIQPDPVCERCDNVGFIVVAQYKDGVYLGRSTIACDDPNCPVLHQQRDQRYQLLIQKSRLPAEYALMTFAAWESLSQSKEHMRGKWDAYGAALAFVAARDRGFWFSLNDASRAVHAGVNGVGKTSLASSVVNALVACQVPAMYVRVADFLAAVKERFDKKAEYEFDYGDSEQAIIRSFQEAPVLVWDEFGLKQYTDWRLDMVEQVVRYRYSHQMPTIFTTNLRYEELADEAHWQRQIGHAVHGMAHWIEMGGLELRQRRGAIRSR
jgi:DNA replication protein DnaC